MTRLLCVVAGAVMLGAAASHAAPQAGMPLTPWQVTTRFKQATGEKLVVNRKTSYPGHYVALDLGTPTIYKKARYGTFTIHVVSGGDVEADVTDLLADGHTGVLGEPGAGNIHWESGKTIYGDRFWLAKRRYGANLVLWWTSTTAARKTDVTWTRLHRALAKVTSP